MLIVTDLHLTDKEADEYRWQLFNWVASWYESSKDGRLVILGDLTDAKDHHSAKLVSRIIWNLNYLRDLGMEIFILKGNHDYIDPTLPFFGFLNLFQRIHYITDPEVKIINGLSCLFLPHTRDPIGDWKRSQVVQHNSKKAKFVFMHQSVIGSVTSNGYKMLEGLQPNYFKRFFGRVISGDIHVPQKIGPVTYVGAPYSVRFNDHFAPRAIEISRTVRGGVFIGDTTPNIPGRWTLDISSVDEINAPEGFQVKVRVHLDDIEQWPTYKAEVEAKCKQEGLILCSIQLVKTDRLPLRKKEEQVLEERDPGIIVYNYGKRQGLSRASINTGRKMVDDG